MKNFMKNNRVWKKFCLDCRHRKALFRFRGVVKHDDDHKLCFRCYRSHVDRFRVVSVF